MLTERRWLRATEVADLFGVNPKTVTRWARAGRLGCMRTPGGHRRFLAADVARLVAELTDPGSLIPPAG